MCVQLYAFIYTSMATPNVELPALGRRGANDSFEPSARNGDASSDCWALAATAASGPAAQARAVCPEQSTGAFRPAQRASSVQRSAALARCRVAQPVL